MTLGITAANFSPNSFERLKQDLIYLPLTADVDYFSSATSGGAQGSQVIAAATAGTAVFLSAIGTAAPLRNARLPTLTITDAAFASALSVTVRIVGRRFGRRVSQDITVTSTNTSPTTVAGTHVLDEVTSASIVAISNPAASDTLSLGFDGTTVGLSNPIASVRGVKFVEKIVAGTPDANAGATAGQAGAVATTGTIRAGSVVQSSTYVNVVDSSIRLAALYNNVAIAATDVYIVDFRTSGVFEYEVAGKRYA